MGAIGIDIGGTFTDIVCIEEGKLDLNKVPTTPADLIKGVLEAIQKVDVDPSTVQYLVHGSTVGINAIVEKKGAKVGVVTTDGFRDILEMGRGNKGELFNYRWRKPLPMVPRCLRQGIRERTLSDGTVKEPVDPVGIERAAKVFRREGVEAVAICFLHSYINPRNEIEAARQLKELLPEAEVVPSHMVCREIREYERTSTTVLCAYVAKAIRTYLDDLSGRLRRIGLKGGIFLLGPIGTVGLKNAKDNPLYALSSGPIAGAIGATCWAKLLNLRNVLTIDVGGTTADVAVIKDGRALKKNETEIGGYPVLLPCIDVSSIGAGGGSIARVDEAGLLIVGPQSAGADPGPICYGKGGEEPTVTDAAVICGIIDPENFLGGSIRLEVKLAEKGLRRIGNRLGLDIQGVAEAVLSLCRSNMADAVRKRLVQYGLDPRDFVLMAFGGGGGLFASSIAEEVGMSKTIIPPDPSVFSAKGLLFADLVFQFSYPVNKLLEEADLNTLKCAFEEMEASAENEVKKAGVRSTKPVCSRILEMCYEGQHRYIEVSFPLQGPQWRKRIERAFSKEFRRIYGYELPQGRPVIVNLRLVYTNPTDTVLLREMLSYPLTSTQSAYKGSRSVRWEGESLSFKIYERYMIDKDTEIFGPAIIEEPSHTTVVAPGQKAIVDQFGNIVIFSRS